MKYILEIKPEYEANGIMILGARDSHLYVTTLEVKDLEELNSDYINEHYGDLQDEAYHRGLAEGKKAFDLLDAERDAEYQRGLNDAWEMAKKISLMSPDEIEKVFPGAAKYNRYNLGYSGIEAIEKLKAYEEKQKADDEIKVGDEVYCKGDDTSDSGVVTWVGKKRVCAMWQDGSAGEVEKDELIKTNRHFDIASILKEMQS